MVAETFISSSIAVLFDCMQRIEISSINHVTSLHTVHFFIDYYVIFMAQSALMSCTILYFLPSYILGRCLDKFANDMYRVGVMFDGECENGGESISGYHYENVFNKISCDHCGDNDNALHMMILQKAANVIEFNFKYIAFYVQTTCLIGLSCLLYAYPQNLDLNWFDTILFLVVVGQITSFILSFIVPAYLIYEKNKKISEICPEMFEKQMQKDSNFMLATKVLMFMYQLERTPIIFTSGGFFVIKRSLLPTLVSFMLTYVFLMLQLGQTPKCVTPLETL
uniref:Gustatory receptor n=1 Tax=Elaeophora elaphi TaxID=1147741 RepID=A0A0R3RSY8_9BILA